MMRPSHAPRLFLFGLQHVLVMYAGTVAAGGGLLVLLGFLPKLAAVIAGIPRPVLGGASIVMFGDRGKPGRIARRHAAALCFPQERRHKPWTE